MTHDSANHRRADRKSAPFTAVVTDVITNQPIGHLGNLSSTGMLLIGSQAPRSEAIYQVSLPLPKTAPAAKPTPSIELGIQEQWQEPAANPGQIWSGYRIVAISDADAARLEYWLSQA
jgi:hypothetical protein